MSKSLEREIASLRRDLDNLGASLAALKDRGVEEIEGTIDDYADEISSTAKERWQSAGRHAKELGRKSQDYMKDHPWQTLSAGLAVGFLVAALLRRRD